MVLPLVFVMLYSFGMMGQSTERISKTKSQDDLDRAIELIEYNQNDAALKLLLPLWEQMQFIGKEDSAFGMRVQLAVARAKKQNYVRDEAILLFNQLLSKSKENEDWNIYAAVCLSMTEFYEEMHRQRLSRSHLDLAIETINHHQIDSLYPNLVNRQALWNIRFSKHPDSIQHYAQKALDLLKDREDLSPGLRYSFYFIQGRTNGRINPIESRNWYKKAVELAKSLNDPVRKSLAWNEITQSYKDLTTYRKEVLAYSDSTIQACYQAIESGYSRIYTLHNAYLVRSRIFYSNNQLDSALYYTKKGLYQEIAFINRQQLDRVAEVDAKYRDEQKNKQLVEQSRAIQTEKRIRKLLIAFFAVTLLLVIGLTFGLINHRNGMKKLAIQNKLIQEQSEKLKSFDKAKSRFFANVSHELRTPLTLMIGPISSALKSGTLDNRNFTLLTMAHQNAKSLLGLIGSLLNLSKIDHNKLSLYEKPENVFLLLRRIVSAFESHAQREGIELAFQYQAERDLTLEIDGGKLKDILNNLLSNAIKFTQPGGKIKVQVSDNENGILISVSDTGRGIPSKDLPYVFDRFYQVEDSNTITEGGSGIGLSYCKELVTIMKGKIWVESQINVGSTFYVELPRNEVLGVTQEVEEALKDDLIAYDLYTHKNEVVPTTDGKIQNNTSRSTIMVVEDNYSLRDYLTTILDPFYNVVTARNGKDALALLTHESDIESSAQTTPSLIISDVMMPIMDGFQFMERLKSDDRYSRLPLVMLTARADIRDKLKALRIGVDDYILKPFEEEEVLVRIANLLERYSIRKNVVDEENGHKIEIPSISEQDRQWLEKFELFIQQNLTNELLNIHLLTRHFAMSESTLLRKLKYLTGMSPTKYVQEIKLDKSRIILEQNRYNSISQVASEVGYKDSRSFSRSFKKRYGKSPSEYIKSGVL